ncbi:MAG: hypothetical protein AAFX87_10895 [Bacteroidota bacterium]
MRYLLVAILTFAPFGKSPDVSGINKMKDEAKAAYNKGEWQTVIDKYAYLIDSVKLKEDAILLNLANAYFNLKDTSNTIPAYEALLSSKNSGIKSVAYQQLGVLANRDKQPENALEYFKGALKANPDNEDARYNYELIKKALKKKEEKDGPSDFAKQLKAAADKLVSQFRFLDAYTLMIQGAEKDDTVEEFYGEFIGRIAQIVNIDYTAPSIQ